MHLVSFTIRIMCDFGSAGSSEQNVLCCYFVYMFCVCLLKMEQRVNAIFCLKFGDKPIITTNLHKRKVCVKFVLHSLQGKKKLATRHLQTFCGNSWR